LGFLYLAIFFLSLFFTPLLEVLPLALPTPFSLSRIGLDLLGFGLLRNPFLYLFGLSRFWLTNFSKPSISCDPRAKFSTSAVILSLMARISSN
jgi:hypothetical protein